MYIQYIYEFFSHFLFTIDNIQLEGRIFFAKSVTYHNKTRNDPRNDDTFCENFK